MEAYHLDGLWRSERDHISIHIEGIENGIKVKRSDQGIWYRYITDDQVYYVDRIGNYYEVLEDDQLIWHETHSNKQIRFTKVNYRNGSSWNQPYINHHEDHRYTRGQILDRANGVRTGQWHDARNGKHLIIENYRDGIRLKQSRDHWTKYRWVRHDHEFRDSEGNTIRIIDQNTLRWISYHGKNARIYRYENSLGHYDDRGRSFN
jgi:hypothetical protein